MSYVSLTLNMKVNKLRVTVLKFCNQKVWLIQLHAVRCCTKHLHSDIWLTRVLKQFVDNYNHLPFHLLGYEYIY